MIVRATLCALDWNYNVGRPQKKDEFGAPMWKEKVDRSGKNRTVVPALVPKDTSWQDKIFDMCIESLQGGIIPSPKVLNVNKYLTLISDFIFLLVSC